MHIRTQRVCAGKIMCADNIGLTLYSHMDKCITRKRVPMYEVVHAHTRKSLVSRQLPVLKASVAVSRSLNF